MEPTVQNPTLRAEIEAGVSQSLSHSVLVKAMIFLLVSLQGMMIWQAQRQINKQDELVMLAQKNQIESVSMAKELAGTQQRLTEAVQRLDGADTATLRRLEVVEQDVKQLDRRVSKVEVYR